jgi:hypothetical protein
MDDSERVGDLERVTKDGLTLKSVPYQTPKICLAAVQQNGMALRFVKEQTPEICLAAVRQNGIALQYVPVQNQTPELCLAAVKQNGLALEYAGLYGIYRNRSIIGKLYDRIYHDKPTENDIYLAAVQQNGNAIHWTNQTPELCLAAVRQNGGALRWINKQTREICLAAVQQNGSALSYVYTMFLTFEICLAAVTQDGNALQFVKQCEIEQNRSIMQRFHYLTCPYCWCPGINYINYIAVKQNGMALRWVYEQTLELCLTAVRQNSHAIQYVKQEYSTYDLCLVAIQQDGLALKYIGRLNLYWEQQKLDLEAVKQNGLALQFITDNHVCRTTQLCLAAIRQNKEARRYITDKQVLLLVDRMNYEHMATLNPTHKLVYNILE